MTQKLTLLRLEKETADLQRNPIEHALVRRVNTFDFHFCLHGLDAPYTAGLYHGLLQLHQNYPFSAPKLYFYTPSGRFEVNTPICTTFTSFHQETWTSAWNVRALIVATISFMYSEEVGFGTRFDPTPVREAYARRSRFFNLNNPQFLALFGNSLPPLNPLELMPQQNPLSDQFFRSQQQEPLENHGQFSRVIKGCLFLMLVIIIVLVIT